MTTRIHHRQGGEARDGASRTAAVVGLAGFALIHLLDLPATIKGTPYIGWMYIGLIVASLLAVTGGVLTRRTISQGRRTGRDSEATGP